METAEEFLNANWRGEGLKLNVNGLMIEFAKMHVQAALKAASENAQRKKVYNGHSERLIVKRVIDKESILNAYPLTNIK